jgi:hypothetical protein
MSNFQTFGAVTEGLEGSAPARFIASTTDSYATLIAAGYLNDISKKIKANDTIDINYLDASAFPLNVGESSVFASFRVQYDPSLGNWNLIPANPQSNIISSLGLHSSLYSNAGGSATLVISDPLINPNSVVQLRIKSSANSVAVEKVLPGNGQVTVLFSGDPGASVISYISFLPSLALQNVGLYGAQYSYAGGSATLVIYNANITASMIGDANLVSSANAVKVLSVLAAAGTLTIVFSSDPGVSVVSYMAVLPSTALSNDGLYSAQYSNAGGSATITITDANILAGSVVVADFASQANAVYIEKVTASAGSLVILANADPGVSVVNYSATPAQEGALAGSYLLAANNLSDVASASSSLANLGGLALAGGQMTGSILLDRGTATSTSGAATINHQAGVVTTESLSTASGSAYSFALTNSRILSTSIVLCQLLGGTNTKHGLSFTAVPSNGSAAISVLNNDISAASLNGTLIFGFVVI